MEWNLSCFKERKLHEVVMIIHETVSVTDPVMPFIDMLKRFQKGHAILVVFKDSFLLVAARGDMIHPVRKDSSNPCVNEKLAGRCPSNIN